MADLIFYCKAFREMEELAQADKVEEDEEFQLGRGVIDTVSLRPNIIRATCPHLGKLAELLNSCFYKINSFS